MAASMLSLAVTELSSSLDTTAFDNAFMVFAASTLEVSDHHERVCIPNYVEEIVPCYPDSLFRAHFRMTRESFEDLLQLIAPHTTVKTTSLEKRTLACLWYLSNTETFRSVADRFNISKGSLHYNLTNFCNVLTGEIMPNLICWPKEDDYHKIAQQHAQRCGFPGVVGLIDGTYIPISAPSTFRDSYICRKGFAAMQLQGICDSSLKFLDVYCAFPASVHDARVFRNSPIKNFLETQPLPEQYHLLGDSAYGLSKSMLVPFRDNGHLSGPEKHFNALHSSTRVDIERCFGLLKGKFRKLKCLDMKDTRKIPYVVCACCTLHNFILDRESFQASEVEVGEQDSQEALQNDNHFMSGTEKREDITTLLA